MAEDDTQQNPFSRPGFIIGAIVVAALIAAAIFLTVLNLNGGDEAASPPPGPASPAATPTPTPDASEAANGASVCGLDGEVLTGTVTTAPSAEWAYVRTVAYPTSSTFGPAASSPEGVPTCFQHSPTGALFAAATALAIPAEPTLVRPWLANGLSSGPYRESLLSDAENTSDSSGIRLQLVGFRVLAYDGETARIDLAVRGSTQGTTITASTVYDLIWEDGDWKINANVANPFDFATIPDTSGYIAWGQ